MVSNTAPAEIPLGVRGSAPAASRATRVATTDGKFWIAPTGAKDCFLRTNTRSSTLVRLLEDWTAVKVPPGMDVAERLALWVDAFDAIGLQAAQQPIQPSSPARRPPGKPTVARHSTAKVLSDDFLRVRAALTQQITSGPEEALEADAKAQAAYAAYHARHLRLQREMEQVIAALRERVRLALGHASPALRQLAAMDAVLERVISPREQSLLPVVTSLMQRRFEQLRLLHLQAVQAEGSTDDPALWRRPGAWLAVFGNEWRCVLQGELDLRLEPVAGLIEGLRNESKNYL